MQRHATSDRTAAASGGGGSSGLVSAAVLALGRGGRQIAGQARRAGLDRRRVAEHHLPAPRLDVLVRHDDKEIHHGHEDNEIDDRGYEGAEIYDRLRIIGPDLHAQPGLAAGKALHDRVDDVGGEGEDKTAERESDDQPDRDDDYVTTH